MIAHRTSAFAARHGRYCIDMLGGGVGQDGSVWRTNLHTAAKFFDRVDRFRRELDVYRLLTERNIHDVAGHAVPEFVLADEELLAIEMTIVNRPFVLDFAGAKLPHEIPDFGPEIMEEHFEHLQELFGSRWTDALHVAEMFRLATGYTLLDIHPGNIAFADMDLT